MEFCNPPDPRDGPRTIFLRALSSSDEDCSLMPTADAEGYLAVVADDDDDAGRARVSAAGPASASVG